MKKRAREGAGTADGDVAAPAVRWFHACGQGRVVLLALLTDEGPSAYSLSPLNANLLADLLRDASGANQRSVAE